MDSALGVRHQLLRHRQRLRRRRPPRLDRGNHRPLVRPGRRAARTHRAGHQALRHHDGPAQRVQAVRAEHPPRPGRQPQAAADGLHRPLPVPPRRPGHAVGRDLAGDRRRGPAGQDPVCRQQQLRRLAHRPGPGGGRPPPLHRPGQRAVHLQPADPRRRAGGHSGRAAVRAGADPLVAAAGRAAGRRAEERSATASAAPRAARSKRSRSTGTRSGSTRTSPTNWATNPATLPWPGCCTSRP